MQAEEPKQSNEANRDSASASSPNEPLINHSRRRFTQASVAASGIVLTLTSRPLMASGKTAKSPSGFVSGNQSTYGPPQYTQGRSPGFWKNHTGDWPSSTNAKFKDHFNSMLSSPYSKYTLLELLSPQQDDPHNLGMHLVAALLNARKGWTPFLDEAKVKAMFAEWQATGVFHPTATVSWTAPEIVTYLQSTML